MWIRRLLVAVVGLCELYAQVLFFGIFAMAVIEWFEHFHKLNPVWTFISASAGLVGWFSMMGGQVPKSIRRILARWNRVEVGKTSGGSSDEEEQLPDSRDR